MVPPTRPSRFWLTLIRPLLSAAFLLPAPLLLFSGEANFSRGVHVASAAEAADPGNDTNVGEIGQVIHGAKRTARPNIVIILVDDMGYGDPRCYNRESKIPTPSIDQLAREGMRFTDAHAAGPLCHLSRYGLMTGQYPFRVSFNWRRKPVIDEARPTIASLLRSNGYHTAMVGKWHLGFVEAADETYTGPLRGGPVDRGFDSFFGIRASTDIPPYFYIRNDRAVAPPINRIDEHYTDGWTKIQGEFWRAGKISPDMRLEEALPRLTDEAITVITEHASSATTKEKPLLLHLAFPSPHTPWLPVDGFRGTSQASLYGDFTVMVDAMIGKVLASLDAHSMRDDTLVVFSSDNGPVWYDQDVERFHHDASGGLRGMKADAWEGGHRMPFIARWPRRIAAGSVTDQTICFTDLMATCAAISGTDLPAGSAPDSFDVSPVLFGDQPSEEPIRGPIAMASGSGMMMVRDRNWKLIDGLGSGGFSKPTRLQPNAVRGVASGQLYDLANDLAESQNIYEEHPAIVKRLRTTLKSLKQSKQTRP